MDTEKSRTKIELFDVSTLSGGAVGERITRTLDRVASNILDRNTDAASKREVTIKLVLTPSKVSRKQVTLDVSVSAKLAAESSDATSVRIVETPDGVTRFEEDPDAAHDPRQMTMAEQMADRSVGATAEVVGRNLATQLADAVSKGQVS